MTELKESGTINFLYQQYYLDYASYVILDRAVPALGDGLKPVQRRILHALEELDDGRFNKVANVIGHCMRYHPHGDASIGDALINLGQKDLLIETQGNWGNLLTGDSAAAPRYIEARLSKFAKEVAFNKETTTWQPSYDGRSKEPVILPMKFPLLLAQGAEGIAVGLSTKIMPHNFVELLEASISALKGEQIELYPDFPTAGIADFSDYNQGRKGSKIRVRAKIEFENSKLLKITQIPWETTTTSLIESIISAAEKGKIKIKKVEDNTARDVEILIHLQPGADPDNTIEALYAFTKCEVSINPFCCVIDEGRPKFLSIGELVQFTALKTKDLLQQELEIKHLHLLEKIFFASLERIFIEEKVYRAIEACETWEEVLSTITKKMTPHAKNFHRPLNEDDVIKLTEIKIKRLSKFDSNKAQEALDKFTGDLEETEKNLKQIVKYTTSWFKHLLKEYGKGRNRRTEISSFKAVDKAKVAHANKKLFVNAKDGLIGTDLKKEQFLFDVSDLNEVLCITRDGNFTVVKAPEKQYVGKDLIYVSLFKRNDESTIYNLIFRDGRDGPVMVKRFPIDSVIRDKPYSLTKETPGSRVLYLGICKSPDELEEIKIKFAEGQKLKQKVQTVSLSEFPVKSRTGSGTILTRHKIEKIEKIENSDET